jgi:beta-glucanase (GH16 family)
MTENETTPEVRRAGGGLWSSVSRVSLCAAALSVALAAPSGCGGGGGGTVTQVQAAATPTISPAAGTYTSTQSVTITDSTVGATIYYTVNGTAPTTSSTQYTSAISVSSTQTVEAIAAATGYSNSAVASATYTINLPTPTPTPVISTSAAMNGAVIVSLSDSAAGATIYFTLDGSTPTTSSPQYLAPFLVASNETVNAVAVAAGDGNSNVATQAFSPSIASGTLVWEDDFANTGTTNAQPNPATWTYDTGYQCCGNNEQETYCAWGSSTSPCDPSNPNAYVAPGGGLDIVAENPGGGTTYTSARLKSEGLFSFQYGRIEATMSLPESQGMWPAFWMLGNNITTISWPACGEGDIMEHIDVANTPFGGPGTGVAPGYDWIAGSVHGGTSSNEVSLGNDYPTSLAAANGFSAAAVHTYGMIWTKGQIEYYVDSPTNIYATDNTSNFQGTWPFDQGPMFIILNLAVGGDWPGDVNSSTVFPSTMQVQDVKIYTN